MKDRVSELEKQNNQLIGENNALKNALSLRDPEMITKISEGFSSMKELLHILQQHDVQAKEIQKDTTIIREDLDKISDFCKENVKPVLAKIKDKQ